MSTDMSNYLENALLNLVLRNTGSLTGGTAWLAIHVGAPGEDAATNEVATGGYARVACAFDAPSDGVTQNTDVESFSPSGTNWGSVDNISLWTAVSGGTSLFYGSQTTARTINDGDTLEFAAASISVTLT
jgi:hypothetical protein